MEWYEEEVGWLERRLGEYPPPPSPVVFYGSSSIRLWSTLGEEFSNDRVVNMAFGGSTLEACAWFFERLIVPCAPRSIICYAGDNDLGDGKSPEQTLASFRTLLAKVDACFPDRPFSFMSIKLSPARLMLSDRIRETNELIHREFDGRERRYFIDIHSRMLLADGQPDANLFLDDGLHVSPAGYIIWRTVLNEWRERIF